MISLNYWVFTFFFIGVFVCGLSCGWAIGYRESNKPDNNVVSETESNDKPQLIIKHQHNGDEIKLADKLTSEISNTYFELGMAATFDYMFDSMCETNGYDVAANALHYIAANENNGYILNGVIHIVSRLYRDYGGYDQESIYDFVVSVCEECIKKMDSIKDCNLVELQDSIISCIERWDIKKAIPLLESMNIQEEEAGMRSYRDEIVNHMRSS